MIARFQADAARYRAGMLRKAAAGNFGGGDKELAGSARSERKRVHSVSRNTKESLEHKTDLVVARAGNQIHVLDRTGLDGFESLEVRHGIPAAFVTREF